MREEYLLSGPLEPTNEPYAIAKIAGIKMCQAYNRQYGTNFISVMPTNLYGPNDNYDLMDSPVLPALIRKFHLAKLLSQGRFDDIVKDFKHFGNSPDFVHRSGYLGVKDCLLPTAYSSGGIDGPLLPAAYSLIVDHLSEFGIKLSSSWGVKSVSFPKRDIDNSLPTAYCPVLPVSNGVTVELWGTGEARREFMYSDDMADACVFLMEREAEAISSVLDPQTSFINIGTGEDITIGELSQKVVETVGFKGEIQWDTTKPDGAPQKLLSVSRLHHLGWRHKISLQEGLRLTYQDFLSHSTP